MENKAYTVSLEKNPVISMKVVPGHFATSHFHISHYLDVSDLKTNATAARDVARELSIPYLANTLVDSIVCMKETEVIGAYMAEELLQAGISVINSSNEIHVLKPTNSVSGKLIFEHNLQEWIFNRNIILLVDTISSGRTIKSAMDCLSYYGGLVVGISALFHGCREEIHHKMHAMFTYEDIPDYQIFSPDHCAMCEEGSKLDAIITSEGYIKI